MRSLSCKPRALPPSEKPPFGDKGGGGGFFSVSHPDTVGKSPLTPLYERGESVLAAPGGIPR